MISDKEKIGIGIFFSALILSLFIMMCLGIGMIWDHVEDHILKYSLSLITIIVHLLSILMILLFWRPFSSVEFSETYKAEATIVHRWGEQTLRNGTYTDFDLGLQIKREDGSSYKTKAWFRARTDYKEYFKIGKKIIVDVSANDPNKVILSDDTFK